MASAGSEEMILQRLLLPDPTVGADPLLYARLDRAGDIRGEHIHLAPGARVTFDTYFNAFDLGAWGDACGLETLGFSLEGAGEVLLRLIVTRPGADDETVFEAPITLAADARYAVDLSHLTEPSGPGVLWAEVEARGPARIDGLGFTTRDRPATLPRLTISITTFQREAQVLATVKRLESFLAGYEQRDRVRVQIVDNGSSLSLPEADRIVVLPNPNLGGAGGFARGLIEARSAGASHCLFIDDDAAFHPESIRRSFAFLALAKDPATALAGAMIARARPGEMWENGALFDGVCRPLDRGSDLTDRAALFTLLFAVGQPLPENGYGGWWFFAFPTAQAEALPFPFFLRGDDSGFSLANPFRIRTPNGVAAVQEGFAEKESPLIHYLDTRYHLVHHLAFPVLGRSPARTAFVALRLILRSLVSFHYESARAQLLAVDDVLRGPAFFAQNADLSERRARITEMTRRELWRPMKAEAENVARRGLLPTAFWALTLNGHLLPLHGRFGAQRILPRTERGQLRKLLGASQVTYIDAETGEGYSVRQSKSEGLRLLANALSQTVRVARATPRLKRAYRARYGEFTSEAHWRKLLGMPAMPRD